MKIFVSFAHRQRGFAGKLSTSLRKIGVRISSVNLRHSLGNDIFDLNRLNEAVPNLDYVIAVLSKAYVEDDWLKKELIAFKLKENENQKSSGTKLIIPIIFETCKIPDILKDKDADRVTFDFRKPFKDSFDKLTSYISANRQVFIVMKLGDKSLESAYKGVMQPVIKEFKFSKKRIDDISNSGKISQQIVDEIARSEIVLADLTGERPNCYYEAGYAEALGKEVVLTAKKGTDVHFDLRDNRVIFWEEEDDFRVQLRERFKVIRNKVERNKI